MTTPKPPDAPTPDPDPEDWTDDMMRERFGKTPDEVIAEHRSAAPRGTEPRPDPRRLPDEVEMCPRCGRIEGDGNALARAREEGRREGIEEAARVVNARKQSIAISRDRAKAAGREGVAEFRDSEVVTLDAVEAAVRSLAGGDAGHDSGGDAKGSKGGQP